MAKSKHQIEPYTHELHISDLTANIIARASRICVPFTQKRKTTFFVRFHFRDTSLSPSLVLEYIGSKVTADRIRQCQSAFCRSSNVFTTQGLKYYLLPNLFWKVGGESFYFSSCVFINVPYQKTFL